MFIADELQCCKPQKLYKYISERRVYSLVESNITIFILISLIAKFIHVVEN